MGTLFLFLFLSLQLNTAAYAVPADPSPKELRQADGTAITGYACGDEFSTGLKIQIITSSHMIQIPGIGVMRMCRIICYFLAQR